jgi:hypothetical protein
MNEVCALIIFGPFLLFGAFVVISALLVAGEWRLLLAPVILVAVVGVLWMGPQLLAYAFGRDGETIVSFAIFAIWGLAIVAYPLIGIMFLGLVFGPPILRTIGRWKRGY